MIIASTFSSTEYIRVRFCDRFDVLPCYRDGGETGGCKLDHLGVKV